MDERADLGVDHDTLSVVMSGRLKEIVEAETNQILGCAILGME